MRVRLVKLAPAIAKIRAELDKAAPGADELNEQLKPQFRRG
ncbi:MAG: hypothetical protein ACYDD4_14855 [Acidimicrobiales bacterium]